MLDTPAFWKALLSTYISRCFRCFSWRKMWKSSSLLTLTQKALRRISLEKEQANSKASFFFLLSLCRKRSGGISMFIVRLFSSARFFCSAHLISLRFDWLKKEFSNSKSLKKNSVSDGSQLLSMRRRIQHLTSGTYGYGSKRRLHFFCLIKIHKLKI